MIMVPTSASFSSMGLALAANEATALAAEPRVTRLLNERLELVEDLWQTVLRSECPPHQAERLLRMKELSAAVEAGEAEQATAEIVQLIRDMDLAEAIAAARAFSLYFQLVNILEQHIEEDSYLASLRAHHPEDLNDPFVPPLASQTEPATFRELFTRLRALGVPPAQIEQLLVELDIRLVFTAHPTEIVRHTVRHKQRKVAALIHKLEQEAGAWISIQSEREMAAEGRRARKVTIKGSPEARSRALYLISRVLAVDPAALERYPKVRDRVGQRVAVGIRPEHFSAPDEVGDDRVIRGLPVSLIEALGAESLVHVDTRTRPIVSEDMRAAIDDEDAFEELKRQAAAGGQPFVVRYEPSRAPRYGDRVDVGVRTDRIHFFDAQTGLALR